MSNTIEDVEISSMDSSNSDSNSDVSDSKPEIFRYNVDGKTGNETFSFGMRFS